LGGVAPDVRRLDGAVTGDIGALPALLEERRRRLGGEWFIEAFVEGREFNLSLLGGPQDMQLLPPAEMCFVGYPAGKPRIVNYAAKWDEHSFEFHATPRRFDFGAEDGDLLGRLAATAKACWRPRSRAARGSIAASMSQRGPGCWRSMASTPASPRCGLRRRGGTSGGSTCRRSSPASRVRSEEPGSPRPAAGEPRPRALAAAAGPSNRRDDGPFSEASFCRDQPGPADLAPSPPAQASGGFSAS
jgi:hypothetical protein